MLNCMLTITLKLKKINCRILLLGMCNVHTILHTFKHLAKKILLGIIFFYILSFTLFPKNDACKCGVDPAIEFNSTSLSILLNIIMSLVVTVPISL